MSTQRCNPFAEADGAVRFDVKPRQSVPAAVDHIDCLARDNNFPSRQAAHSSSEPPASGRQPRRHKTGRNQQLNFKATAETIERFYRIADSKHMPLCALLELALDALEEPIRVT